MNNTYFIKMLDEFKKAKGLSSIKNCNDFQVEFAEWIKERQECIKDYVELFEYMVNPNEPMHTSIEFGKGINDTISIEMAKNTIYKPIVITPYADTFDKKCGVKVFNGELITLGDEALVYYDDVKTYFKRPNCNPAINDNIDIFMTQLPISDRELKPYFDLASKNKTIIIGTYGLKDDADKLDNLKILSNIHEKLIQISGRDAEFYSEEQNASYLGAIKLERQRRL